MIRTNDDSNLIINDGTLSGYRGVFHNSTGLVTINDGTISGSDISIIDSSSGNILIKDGKINGGTAIHQTGSGTITIEKGTFNPSGTIINMYSTTGIVNVNGGTFESSGGNIVNSGYYSHGIVNINGGTFTGRGINNNDSSSTVNINDGVINSYYDPINNEGTMNIKKEQL